MKFLTAVFEVCRIDECCGYKSNENVAFIDLLINGFEGVVVPCILLAGYMYVCVQAHMYLNIMPVSFFYKFIYIQMHAHKHTYTYSPTLTLTLTLTFTLTHIHTYHSLTTP